MRTGFRTGVRLSSPPPNRYWTNTHFFSGVFAVKCSLWSTTEKRRLGSVSETAFSVFRSILKLYNRIIMDLSINGRLPFSAFYDIIWIYHIHTTDERQQTQAPLLLIALCSTKLIGDLFAWIYYQEFSKAVFVIGILVFSLNSSCLWLVTSGKKKPKNPHKPYWHFALCWL